MYKASKDQVNVFGLQTQFGGGKTTGFALVYDSPEALKKFEPHFRLVRVGFASKIEKPSRQQRTSHSLAEDPASGSIRRAMLIHPQASNARTDRRHSEEQQRSRVPRRRRIHRRIALLLCWLEMEAFGVAGWALSLYACIGSP